MRAQAGALQHGPPRRLGHVADLRGIASGALCLLETLSARIGRAQIQLEPPWNFSAATGRQTTWAARSTSAYP